MDAAEYGRYDQPITDEWLDSSPFKRQGAMRYWRLGDDSKVTQDEGILIDVWGNANDGFKATMVDYEVSIPMPPYCTANRGRLLALAAALGMLP